MKTIKKVLKYIIVILPLVVLSLFTITTNGKLRKKGAEVAYLRKRLRTLKVDFERFKSVEALEILNDELQKAQMQLEVLEQEYNRRIKRIDEIRSWADLR